MSAEQVTWVWAGAGALLMALELVVPGLILVFLGAGALVVAGVRALGWVQGTLPSLTAWFVASSALLLGLRSLLQRLLPGQTERGQTDEDADAFGQVVPVVEAIPGGEAEGRIRFHGTSWPARSAEGPIEAGAAARILYRESNAWVVEPVRAKDTSDMLPLSMRQPPSG